MGGAWLSRIKAGLGKTSGKISKALRSTFGSAVVDESFFQSLEDTLLQADCGVDATLFVLDSLRAKLGSLSQPATLEDCAKALTEVIAQLLQPLQQPPLIPNSPAAKPHVILMVGVNGSGKTTSTAKLSARFKQQGCSVLLAAADTFRAAAVEQLQIWGQRNQIEVISQNTKDPAAVAYEAVEVAVERARDMVIIDTAGRLPTQSHLIDELRRVKSNCEKVCPGTPQDVWLVLDATVGQNMVRQVEVFDAALGVTGLIVTKLDGTAKGGVLLGIAKKFSIPVRMIGVGEAAQDLLDFDAQAYAQALAAL